MAFGQTVADAVTNQEAWIKGFKDGVTRIRIVQELPTWIKYMQHFSKTAFYFPCSKEASCVGCLYPDELDDQGRPKMSVQYAFNAIDEQGRLNIYRLGTKAFKILQSRHQRLETLVDRDYNIVRSGKGFDTTYIPEPGDKYEVVLPEQQIDILNALALKYEEARVATLTALEEAKEEAAQAAADTKVPTAPKAEPKEAPPLRKVTEEDKAAAAAAVEAQLGDNVVDGKFGEGSKPVFEDMGNAEIRKWIEETHPDTVIPNRPSRATLVEIAEGLPAF